MLKKFRSRVSSQVLTRLLPAGLVFTLTATVVFLSRLTSLEILEKIWKYSINNMRSICSRLESITKETSVIYSIVQIMSWAMPRKDKCIIIAITGVQFDSFGTSRLINDKCGHYILQSTTQPTKIKYWFKSDEITCLHAVPVFIGKVLSDQSPPL